MLIHNTFLVLVNGGGLFYALPYGKWGLMSLKCERFTFDMADYGEAVITYVCYIYYVSKFVDFLDTIYFVLRKKYSHITGLHLFHHSMMPFWCYVFFKFGPYTNIGFIPLVNAGIHFIMYSYYALASLGPSVQKYLWWKKYITQLQLLQFVAASIHSGYFLFDKSCDCPKFLIFMQFAHSVLFFFLFLNFYIKSYDGKSHVKIDEDAVKPYTKEHTKHTKCL